MQFKNCPTHGPTIPVSDDGLHEGVCWKCEQEADIAAHPSWTNEDQLALERSVELGPRTAKR